MYFEISSKKNYFLKNLKLKCQLNLAVRLLALLLACVRN